MPLARLPASSASGGGIGAFKLNAGNPNMAVAGNANVNGASDMCYDYTNNILYVCTRTDDVDRGMVADLGVHQLRRHSAGHRQRQRPGGGRGHPPASFTLQTGYQVTVVPNTANSGSTTLNVASTGVKTIQKLSGGSLVNLSGGELAGGTPATVTYNGTVWVLGAGAFGTIAYLNVGNGLRNDGSGNLQTDMAFASDSAGTVAVTAAMQATQRVAAGAVSYTLPTSTGKWSGFGFQFFALGGAVTFTLATGTDAINGGTAGASLAVPQGYAGEVYTDANGNYYVQWGAIEYRHRGVECRRVWGCRRSTIPGRPTPRSIFQPFRCHAEQFGRRDQGHQRFGGDRHHHGTFEFDRERDGRRIPAATRLA